MSNIAQKMKSDQKRLHNAISEVIDSLPDRIRVEQLVSGTTYKLSSVIRENGVIIAEIDVRINVN